MKKSNWPKFISEIYKEAGYSDEIITKFEWMESQHPSLEALLEKYRYIQPDGELFSEHSLQIIIALYDIENLLESQRDITHEMESRLKNLVNLTFKQRDEPIDFLSREDVF
jgi:hypothetical protein